MSFYQNWCRLAVLAITMLCVPGCWDYQKINERAQIIGIGVDRVAGDPNLMSFTLQVPVLGGGDAKGDGTGRGSSGLAGDYRNLIVRAEGVNEAVTKAQSLYDKMFYLGNLQTVVMNQGLTSNQVHHLITEMIRTPYLDKLAWLVFTSQPALDILRAEGSSAPADEIDRFFGISVKQHGLTTRTRLWEFWRDDRAVGIEPHTSMIRTTDNRLQLYGVMVFNSARPVWNMDPSRAVYFNFLDDRVQRLTMWFQDGPRKFEVHNIFGKSRTWVSMRDGRPVLHAKLSASGILAQDETDGMQRLSEREMNRYESVMEQQLIRECTKIIHQLQQHQCDALGFGQYVYVHHFESEPDVEAHWTEEFSHAPLDIQANVRLLQKGILM